MECAHSTPANIVFILSLSLFLFSACLDCDKVFATNGLLEMHRQKMHEDPPLLACKSCSVDFKRKMGKSKHFKGPFINDIPEFQVWGSGV